MPFFAVSVPFSTPVVSFISPAAATAKTEPTVRSTLQALEKKIDDLKEAASDKGLEMGAFFDVNAKTGNSTDQTFSFGSLELDLDYAYNGHFGASAALVCPLTQNWAVMIRNDGVSSSVWLNTGELPLK